MFTSRWLKLQRMVVLGTRRCFNAWQTIAVSRTLDHWLHLRCGQNLWFRKGIGKSTGSTLVSCGFAIIYVAFLLSTHRFAWFGAIRHFRWSLGDCLHEGKFWRDLFKNYVKCICMKFKCVSVCVGCWKWLLVFAFTWARPGCWVYIFIIILSCLGK